MYTQLTQALKETKPEPYTSTTPSLYHAALAQWNQTVQRIAQNLRESSPEFNAEKFYRETTYWSQSIF